MQHDTAIQKRAAVPKRAAVVLHAEFFLTGTVTALLGAILPAIRMRYGVSDEQAGSLFVAQFAGSSLGALLSQVRYGASVAVGSVLIAAGLAALAFSPWPVAHLAVFCFGLGLGLAIPATNVIIAHAGGERRAASLNILNMVWGAGAATSPLVVALLQHWFTLTGSLVFLAAIAGFIFVVVLLAGIAHLGASDCASLLTDAAKPRPAQPWIMAYFSLMLFLYVGVESSIGGWTAAYAKEIGLADPIPTVALFCFWLALVGGRALTPITLRFLAEPRLFVGALLLAVCGILFLITSHSNATVTTSAFLTAAGLAPIFASILSLLSRRAERHQMRIPGWVFSLAGMGGAAMPWLVGTVSTRGGSIRYGFLVPAFAIVLILMMLRNSDRFSHQVPPPAMDGPDYLR